MTLNDFFDYVFGNRAKAIALPESVKLSTEQLAKKAVRDAKEKQAKQADFTFITDEPDMSAEFRMMLRAQKSHLEKLLYDNDTDVLEPTKYSKLFEIPTDDDIKEIFTALDDQFRYFAGDSSAADRFVTFFKASKLIADYKEQNHGLSNDVAFQHAYKMLVLFAVKPIKPLSEVDKYISLHASQAIKPVHDILVLRIPVNHPPLKRLRDWRKLIMQHGSSVLSLFQKAAEIERVLDEQGAGEFTLASIKKAAGQLTYKNFNTNPELAKLGMQYHMSEKDFDQCLAIKPKQTDKLPDVIVDGSMADYPGYYLVKLPINDPRAYILGHITNCCQSIGGNSEQCVIDGITRESNGFYVLLHAKDRVAKGAKPLLQARINYDHFDLVGQGYLWLSQLNNLTFDSWENLTPSRDDAVITALLPVFASQCFEQAPIISRVTIGVGGKTPAQYQDMEKRTMYPEKMAEGLQYHDSDSQGFIAVNPTLLKKTPATREMLDKMGFNLGFELMALKQAEWFDALLNDVTVAAYQASLGIDSYQRCIQQISNHPNFLLLIFQCHQAGLLNTDTVGLLLALNPEIAEKISRSLSIFQEINPSLITEENFNLLIQNSRHADKIVECISRLAETNPALITDKLYKFLIQNAPYALNFADIYCFLYEINPALNTDENQKLLIQKPDYLEQINRALLGFKQTSSELFNEDYFKLLVANAEHAEKLSQGLVSLFVASPSLITGENRAWLVDNAAQANTLAKGLACLFKTDASLVTDENQKLLADHAVQADKIAEILSLLFKFNPALITDENRKLLVDRASHAGEIAKGLLSFSRASPTLFTDKHYKLLIQNATGAFDIAHVLSCLYKINPALITDDNEMLLIQNAGLASVIGRALWDFIRSGAALVITDKFYKFLVKNARYADELYCIYGLLLYRINPALITDENQTLLIQKPDYLRSIYSAFLDLKNTSSDLINEDNFKLLVANAEHAEKLSQGLVNLFVASPSLITSENRALLAEHAAQADKIAAIFSLLFKFNPALITDSMRVALSQGARDATAAVFISALTALSKTNSALITEENIKLLAQNAKYASSVGNALLELFQVSPSLITEENFRLLANNGAEAERIVSGLSHLFQTSPELMTPENHALFAKHARHARIIADGLIILQANPELITQNRALLAENTLYMAKIAKALVILFQANPALITGNQIWLAKSAEYADRMAEGLVLLFQKDPALITDVNRELLALDAKYATRVAEALVHLHEHYPASIIQALVPELKRVFAPEYGDAGCATHTATYLAEEEVASRQKNQKAPGQFGIFEPLKDEATLTSATDHKKIKP